MGTSPGDVTQLLRAWREGDPTALEKLTPLVYDDLRRLAYRYIRRERRDHTLQPTALVHEAYLRLADKAQPRWQDRAHFYAVAAQLMRRILVDHARAHRSAKRGYGVPTLSLDEPDAIGAGPVAGIAAIDESLTSLAAIDERKSRVIELRFFGGLTIEETAEVLSLSTATVISETRIARAWLFTDLYGGEYEQ
jgi:RNA polymerase sigma factor (TIGR02999 family)